MNARSSATLAVLALLSGCRYVAIGGDDAGLDQPMLPSAPTATIDTDAGSSGEDEDAATTFDDGGVASLGMVTAIVAGNEHTCALTSTGTVYCWGANDRGQLGNGTTTGSVTPVPVGISGVAAIASGYAHMCALADGRAVCWGANDHGQLGDGTTTDRPSPARVAMTGSMVTSIAAGGLHTCAVTTRGTECWGGNADGQLGDGTTTDSSTPIAVTGASGASTAVAAGGAHTCAISSGGAVSCWGLGTNGQLGNGTTSSSPSPVAVSGLTTGVTRVCAGNVFTCALAGGGVSCWGFGLFGQLGTGDTASTSIPTAISGAIPGASSIATGNAHACAIGTAGAVWCWGDNQSGQLGNGDSALQNVAAPARAVGVQGATALTAGTAHTCVIVAGGVQCWGWNVAGQLGNGTQVDSLAPVEVAGF